MHWISIIIGMLGQPQSVTNLALHVGHSTIFHGSLILSYLELCTIDMHLSGDNDSH